MVDTHFSFAQRWRMFATLKSQTPTFDSNQPYIFIINKLMKQTQSVWPCPHASHQNIWLPSPLFQCLRPSFFPYHRLKLPNHARAWVWSHCRTRQMVFIFQIPHPTPKRIRCCISEPSINCFNLRIHKLITNCFFSHARVW